MESSLNNFIYQHINKVYDKVNHKLWFGILTGSSKSSKSNFLEWKFTSSIVPFKSISIFYFKMDNFFIIDLEHTRRTDLICFLNDVVDCFDLNKSYIKDNYLILDISDQDKLLVLFLKS